MSITTEILRIKGGKESIHTLANKKNIKKIPSSLLIDGYADFLDTNWPDFTYGVTYDGTKIRGKTDKWNQLSPFINQIEIRGNCTTSVSGAKVRVTPTNAVSYISGNTFNTTYNDKYYLHVRITFDSQPTGDTRFALQLINSQTQATNITTSYIYGSGSISEIVSFSGSPGTDRIRIIVLSNENIINYTIEESYVINLTDIFGAGNEPTSVDDEKMQKLIIYAKGNPQYNVGSLTYAYYKGTKLGQLDYIDTTSNILHIGGSNVDLGTLVWAYQEGYFWARISDIAKKGYNTKMTCSKYKTANSISEFVDKTISNVAVYYLDNIIVKDSTYQSSAVFKQAMSGVYLYYELATPIEIDLS